MGFAVTRGFLAQFRDWSGTWSDDGDVYPTAREARDGCIAKLAGLGYSGADVRVLRMTTTRTLEVTEVV